MSLDIENENWRYIWRARLSDRLRLYANSNDFFDQEIHLRIRNSTSGNNVRVTNRIDMKVEESVEAREGGFPRVKITWEVSRGIPHSNAETLRFYGIPAKDSQGPTNLMLSIVRI